jgi:predicted nicotinamide N-methyase
VRNKTVVELGAGLGLASIAASLSGAQFVACTDGDSDLLKLADENLATNAPEAVSVQSLVTTPLLWCVGVAAIIR